MVKKFKICSVANAFNPLLQAQMPCPVSRGAVFNRHPKSLRHAAELYQFKARQKLRQPPACRLLNQMRIAPVREHFRRRAGMHGKHTDP